MLRGARCSVGAGDATRLRIGLDPSGQTLYPTDEERAAAEAQRAAAAESENARLREELQRLLKQR